MFLRVSAPFVRGIFFIPVRYHIVKQILPIEWTIPAKPFRLVKNAVFKGSPSV
jgi:hypothetical protein